MAMSNRMKEITEEEVKMDMTSMIDMTFLLLIFFMCNLHFKAMEGLLPSYLPKDVGVFGGAPITSPIPPIHIKLIKVTDGAEVWMGSEQFSGPSKYQNLANSIQAQVGQLPVSSGNEEQNKIPVILDTDTDVLFQDVVSVLDACRKVQQTPEGAKLEVRFSAAGLSLEDN